MQSAQHENMHDCTPIGLWNAQLIAKEKKSPYTYSPAPNIFSVLPTRPSAGQ